MGEKWYRNVKPAAWKHYFLRGGGLILEGSYIQNHVQELSHTWQTAPCCTSAVSPSHVLCWQASQSTADSFRTFIIDRSRRQKGIYLAYMAYNNATELWIPTRTVKPGYWTEENGFELKLQGFFFFKHCIGKDEKAFWKQPTLEKANSACWANRIITPDQALVYFILLQPAVAHKKLSPPANTHLECKQVSIPTKILVFSLSCQTWKSFWKERYLNPPSKHCEEVTGRKNYHQQKKKTQPKNNYYCYFFNLFCFPGTMIALKLSGLFPKLI